MATVPVWIVILTVRITLSVCPFNRMAHTANSRNNNGRDPLWDFWMFDTNTQWDTMNKGGS
jgi:hypothetical protein